MSCCFDDIPLYAEYITPARTMTETDVAMYVAMTCDDDRKHTTMLPLGDDGKHPIPPLLLFGICHGLLCRTGVFEGVGAIAFAGIDDIEFIRPVFVGDIIQGVVRVSEHRLGASKPGMVYYDYTLINQDGVAVQHSIQKIMRFVSSAAQGVTHTMR